MTGPWKGLVLDLDGTLVHGRQPIPDAAEALDRLAAAGFRLCVVSNNSFLTRAQMHELLESAGFSIEVGCLVPVVEAAGRAAAAACPGGRAVVLGGPSLREALESEGLEVVEHGADVVVVCTDLDLSYQRLAGAVQQVAKGAFFIALNQDRIFVRDRAVWPGGGAMAAAVSYATGREPDLIVGKPSPTLVLQGLAILDLPPQDCAVVGDSLDTDIPAGRAAGLGTVLVLTGAAGATMGDEIGPRAADLVVDSVANLPDVLAGPPLLSVRTTT